MKKGSHSEASGVSLPGIVGQLLLCIFLTTNMHISVDYSSDLNDGAKKVSYRLEIEK